MPIAALLICRSRSTHRPSWYQAISVGDGVSQWRRESRSSHVFPAGNRNGNGSSPASKSCMGEDNFLGFVNYIVWKKYMDYFFVSVYETPSHNYYNYTPAVEPGSDMQQRYLTPPPPPPNIAYAHKGVPPINTLGMHCRGVGAGGAGGAPAPPIFRLGGQSPPNIWHPILPSNPVKPQNKGQLRTSHFPWTLMWLQMSKTIHLKHSKVSTLI